MHHNHLTLTLLFLFISVSGFVSGQLLVAGVTDAKGDGISYVTIYVPAREQGVITDENGLFELGVNDPVDSLTIVFSAIGYQTIRHSYQQLAELARKQASVVLPPATYELDEAEITGQRLRLKQKRLGMKGMLNATYGQTVRSTPIPFEAGPIIRPGKRCRLDAIELKVRDMTADTVILDLNAYNLKGRQPDRQLLRERVFVLLTKNEVGQEISIDLSDQQLWIEGDFIVTFRLLDVKGATGSFSFKAKTGERHGMVRGASGRWRKSYLTPALFALVSYEK